MKALKMMLSGIMLALISLVCITAGVIAGIFLLLLAIALFIWGLMTK